MPLTNKARKAFTEWLEEHQLMQSCPSCGAQGPWNIYDGLLGALDLDLKAKKATPSSTGFFALSCKNCWNTRLFAAPPILGK